MPTGKHTYYKRQYLITHSSNFTFYPFPSFYSLTYRIFPMTSVIAKKDVNTVLCPVILFEYSLNSLGKGISNSTEAIFSHRYDCSNAAKRKIMDGKLYNDLKESMNIIGMGQQHSHVGPRELRRSAVTQLVNKGVDASVIQKLGAWKQLSSVHSYLTASLQDRLKYARML